MKNSTKRKRRGVGHFRRVDLGRNDSRLILKNPEYRRMLRQAVRRLDAGEGITMTTDELRNLVGLVA
jgi:hypothetical protein